MAPKSVASRCGQRMAQLHVWRVELDTPFRHTDTIELQEGVTYYLGRVAGSALLLSDSRVSGRHSLFTARADGVSVCDTSTNGTYLNGMRLEKGAPVALADGDVVTPLVPLKGPPCDGCVPRADLVVAVVYRAARVAGRRVVEDAVVEDDVAAAPCGLAPAATGEASAHGSADSPDQPSDLAASSLASGGAARRSAAARTSEAAVARPPEPAHSPAEPPPKPPAKPPVKPPAKPRAKPPVKPPAELPAEPPAEPAQPSAAFEFDMDAPAPPRGRRRSDGGPGGGGSSGARSTGGQLSKAMRRRGSDAATDDADPGQSLPGKGRTSTTLTGDVLCFLRDDDGS